MAPRVLFCMSAALLIAAPASAQTEDRFDRLWQGDYDGPRRVEVGFSAGYALSSDWSDRVVLQVHDPQGGVHQQVLLRNMSIAPGAGGNVGITYWRGRHAFRATGGYSRSCLTTAARCGRGMESSRGSAVGIAEVPMDVYHYGVQGLVGLLNWEQSRFFRPFLVLGVGGVIYDPDADALPFVPGTFQTIVPRDDGPGVIISDGHTVLLISHSELGMEHVFGATVGIGTDLRIPVGFGGVGLRLELVDQITSSPFSVSVARLDSDRRRYSGREGEDIVFRRNAIHNLRVSAGVVLELGVGGPRTETRR